MFRKSLKVAQDYGQELPAFDSLADAERALYAIRDAALHSFVDHAQKTLPLDFSVGSLIFLEQWFFDSGEPDFTSDQLPFGLGIGYYFGEVLHRQADFSWVVQEFPFKLGHYGLGVERELVTIMLSKGIRPQRAGNMTMRSLTREFKKYAA